MCVRTEGRRAGREAGTKTGMYGLLVAALVLAYAMQALWETQTEVVPLNCGLLFSVLQMHQSDQHFPGKGTKYLDHDHYFRKGENGGRVRSKEMMGGKAEGI